MPTTAATTGAAQQYPATASGAKLTSVPAEAATALLARLGVPAPDSIECAIGAHQDDGTLIGVAALGAVRAANGSLVIAVVPERRRLKIGIDLLHAIVNDAARIGVRRFLVCYARGAVAADALLRSSGLITARRVVNGNVTAVLQTTGRAWGE